MALFRIIGGICTLEPDRLSDPLRSALQWFSQLETSMQPTESLEQYCMCMQRLHQCLRGNNATIEEFHVIKHLVKGLPAEMDQ